MKRYEKSYDVVVIGCGPAGATAGKYAARGGAKTLVIDKKREVGLPVADGTSVIYSLSELESFAGFKFNRGKVEEMQLFGNIFISPAGKFKGEQPWADGYSVRRPELEKALAVSAGNDGADMLMDTRFVEVVKERGKITGIVVQRGPERMIIGCKVIIGADGVYGKVAKQTGLSLPEDVFIALCYDIVGVKQLKPFEKPLYENVLVPNVGKYFALVSQREEGRFSIALDVPPQHRTGTMREMFKRVLNHLEEIGRYDFSHAAEVSMMSGASTTINRPADRFIGDGVMLAGDAGWRPLVGTKWGTPGLPTGVVSGRFAGEAAAEAIKKGDISAKSLSSYQSKLDATFENPEKDRVTMLEGRRWYTELMRADPKIQDIVIGEIGDQYSSLHLYLRGALPLAGCVENIKEWWTDQPELLKQVKENHVD